MKQTIDFVIPWVDGADPVWREAFKCIIPSDHADAQISRFRDWGILRYWFRAVEAFTPWVNRVFFVTWGHIPSWLNEQNPKLRIMKHEDYIPSQYLPTFSSHTIELNLHRIEELSEQFVYFNDDMFILRPMQPSDFFQKGLPVDCALMNPLSTTELKKNGKAGRIFYIPMNNVEYLNRDYDMRECIARHPIKWYSPRYGQYWVRNMMLGLWPRFLGFVDVHLPQPFLKSMFVQAWEQDRDILHSTCEHAIRHDHDVNQWLIRYRQIAEGKFVPKKPPREAVLNLAFEADKAQRLIAQQKISQICLNDDEMDNTKYASIKAGIQEAFCSILPDKCSFEKMEE